MKRFLIGAVVAALSSTSALTLAGPAAAAAAESTRLAYVDCAEERGDGWCETPTFHVRDGAAAVIDYALRRTRVFQSDDGYQAPPPTLTMYRLEGGRSVTVLERSVRADGATRTIRTAELPAGDYRVAVEPMDQDLAISSGFIKVSEEK